MGLSPSTTADLRPFHISDPLPRGITVLEASAGTGKTYAITGLAARYVAEGTPLERILLVTFTRMATGELRERVRERLLAVQRGLAGAGPDGAPDPVIDLIRERGAPEIAVARRRLNRALADFDAGTIATTHGFCQEALGGLGIAADLEPGVAVVEDLSDLVEEVLDDLFLRSFHREPQPAMGRAQALMIARAAVLNPDAVLAPAPEGVPTRRRGLADAARRELEERKRRLGVMTYDDLLMRLQAALAGPDGAAVADRLRARYEVVLVDEFQDTDPVQWEIMRRAFAHEDRALVLIADPKQAIYAFRGADVYAYLAAASQARESATLRTNRRSDQRLLDAYDALFAGAQLGHEGIVYRTVKAAEGHRPPRTHGAPLRVRILPREAVQLTKGARFAPAPAARERIAGDVAADIVRLLGSDAEVVVGERTQGACAPVCPGHVAVLVRTNRQAGLVMAALEEAGVPAVLAGAGSVFATDAARQWLALLEALERPASATRAHGAALTPFVGWGAEAVAQASDESWAALHERLHELARLLRAAGVAALLETITREQGLTERMLSARGGERALTDLRHIGQLLHAAATEEQLGITALAGWLRRRILDAERDSGDEERSRRLESDAEAVQVLTIHRSKGLEFPIIYVPFLWDIGWMPDTAEPVTFHDPDHDWTRTLDVALEGPEFERHRERFVVEQRGEDLRLAYVALTRARHQAIIWWAGSRDSRHSPLSRLLFDRRPDGTVPSSGTPTPSDSAAQAAFDTLAAKAPGVIDVELVQGGPVGVWEPAPEPVAALAAARFARTLDRRWRRTSYTDITARAHESAVASEPEEPAVGDEPDAPGSAPGAEETRPGAPAGQLALGEDLAAGVPSPLAALPAGVAAGTLVHQALETADFGAGELEAELARALAAVPGRRAVAIADPPAVAAGLAAALRTPLGPLLGERRLCDIPRADRIDELAFELPLAGGELPRGTLSPGALARLLRSRTPAGDPMHAYAARLDDPGLRPSVRGYLTGSLDLVARVAAPGGPRFAVVDYKTNWLAEPEEPLSTWNYRPAALRGEMHARHYCLQALLYLVALHRFLRWRLAGYTPERHLAGVLYLFLRGLAGPDTPVVGGERCGVFAYAPPPGLVEALSDLLDGEPGR